MLGKNKKNFDQYLKNYHIPSNQSQQSMNSSTIKFNPQEEEDALRLALPDGIQTPMTASPEKKQVENVELPNVEPSIEMLDEPKDMLGSEAGRPERLETPLPSEQSVR